MVWKLPGLILATLLCGEVSYLEPIGVIGIYRKDKIEHHKDYDLSSKNPTVKKVFPGSPAERAGILEGDYIENAEDERHLTTNIDGESYTVVTLTIKRKICKVTNEPASSCHGRYGLPHMKQNEIDGHLVFKIKREPGVCVFYPDSQSYLEKGWE